MQPPFFESALGKVRGLCNEPSPPRSFQSMFEYHRRVSGPGSQEIVHPSSSSPGNGSIVIASSWMAGAVIRLLRWGCGPASYEVIAFIIAPKIAVTVTVTVTVRCAGVLMTGALVLAADDHIPGD